MSTRGALPCSVSVSLNGPTNKATAASARGYGTRHELEEPDTVLWMTPTAKKLSSQKMDLMNISRQSDDLKQSVSSTNTASHRIEFIGGR